MKKALIIVAIVIIIIAIIIGIVFAKLNKEKISITASEFYNTMFHKGYYVQDSKDQFSEYDYIKQVYIAVDKNYNYKIEFYELSDDSYAIDFYNNNKLIFESSKGSTNAETSVSLKNYSKYTLISNGKYKVISRINNTVIYLNVDDNYKDIVKGLLDELGY